MFNTLKRDERGFSLIELAVVVAIIGILAAIAIPTFLGQRKGAQDRAAHSALRNVMTIAKAAAANQDSGNYPAVSVINDAEPQYTISNADSQGPGTVSAAVSLDGRTLVLAAESVSGSCFFVVTPLDATTGYANSDNESAAATALRAGTCDADLVDIEDATADGTLLDMASIDGSGFGDDTAELDVTS